MLLNVVIYHEHDPLNRCETKPTSVEITLESYKQ